MDFSGAAPESATLLWQNRGLLPVKPSISTKLTQLVLRLEEINALLSSQDVTGDMDNYRKLTREHAEISPVVDLYRAYCSAEGDLTAAQEMAQDPASREFAEAEMRATRGRLEDIEVELQKQLLPKDPNDERNIFLEIRAGTGGEESALFAADLFRMYTRFAERNRWQVEIVSESPGDAGGYKEVIARIAGQGAYSKLKFESGGHRVQRVPETEAQGRIHTSTCTVAVFPEPEDVGEIEINKADLKVDTYRASGAGGQHVNKTDSAIRITHLPTGIVVECQDERSQHKNRARAMSLLSARLRDAEETKRHTETAEKRRSLVGTGDRSERIRTYNFPQGRLTDHRINLTLYKLEDVVEGDLDDVIGPLANEYQADQLSSLGLET